MDKFYKGIDFRGYTFIKHVYELDKDFIISKITKNLNKLKYSMYFINDKFIIVNDKSLSNYEYVLNCLNGFNVKYKLQYDEYFNNDIYLAVNEKGNGCLITLSLVNEKMVYYDVTLNNSKLYACRNMELSLSDDDFRSLFDIAITTINNLSADIFFDESAELTWSEYTDLLKCSKLKSLLTDEENCLLADLSMLKRQIVGSGKRIGDALKILHKAIIDENSSVNVNDLLKFFDYYVNCELHLTLI